MLLDLSADSVPRRRRDRPSPPARRRRRPTGRAGWRAGLRRNGAERDLCADGDHMVAVPVEALAEVGSADPRSPRRGDRRQNLRPPWRERNDQRFGSGMDIENGRVLPHPQSHRSSTIAGGPQQPSTGDLLRQAQTGTGDEDRTVSGRHLDAVAAAYALLIRHPSGIVDDEGRTGRARKHRRHPIAESVQRFLLSDHQAGLGQTHRRSHQRLHSRMKSHRRTADVDDSQESPVMRVVHGHGTAVPRVLRGLKMFGGEELDGCLLGQRRADGVRTDLGFGPMRSFDESKLIGLPSGGSRTISPQNDSIGIRDDEDERRSVGSPQQH